MKILVLLLLVDLFSTYSCKGISKNRNEVIVKLDTVILDEKTIAFVSPSDRNFETLKKKLGNNFYIIADDANYYSSIAFAYLDSIKQNYRITNSDQPVGYYRNGEFVDLKNNKYPWYAIFLHNKKSKVVALPDFKAEYDLFYIHKPHLFDSLANWYGIYYYSLNGNYNNENYKNDIGWFRLLVAKDSILYESDTKMVTEFPVNEPYGIHINYKCIAYLEKDTLFVKMINSLDGNIFRLDDERPCLKLFKKNEKYYGISPVIEETNKLAKSTISKTPGIFLFKRLK